MRRVTAKLRLELSPFDYEIATSDAGDRGEQARVIAANPELQLVDVLDRLAYGRTRKKGSSAQGTPKEHA